MVISGATANENVPRYFCEPYEQLELCTDLVILILSPDTWQINLDIDTQLLQGLRTAHSTALKDCRRTECASRQDDLPSSAELLKVLRRLVRRASRRGAHLDARRLAGVGSVLEEQSDNSGVGDNV